MSLCNCLLLMTPGTFCPFCTQEMVFISWCSRFLHGRLHWLRNSVAQVRTWKPMTLTGFQTEMQNRAIISHFLCTASEATGRHSLQSCRGKSKEEESQSRRVRTLHPGNFKMELHLSKKNLWNRWIKSIWDCCCRKWSGGAPRLTAVQQQEEGI